MVEDPRINRSNFPVAGFLSFGIKNAIEEEAIQRAALESFLSAFKQSSSG